MTTTTTTTTNITNFQRDLETIIQYSDVTDRGYGIMPIEFPMAHFSRIRKLDIGVFDLSNRTHNALRRSGINTIGDVVEKWDVLPGIRNMGVLSVKEIKNGVLSYYYDSLDTEERKEFWRDVFA